MNQFTFLRLNLCLSAKSNIKQNFKKVDLCIKAR